MRTADFSAVDNVLSVTASLPRKLERSKRAGGRLMRMCLQPAQSREGKREREREREREKM